MDRKVTYKVFNRITGEDITTLFPYFITPDGRLYFEDRILGKLEAATYVHEVKYDN